MSSDKFSSVSVIGIHYQRAKQIDLDDFINIFASKHDNWLVQLF